MEKRRLGSLTALINHPSSRLAFCAELVSLILRQGSNTLLTLLCDIKATICDFECLAGLRTRLLSVIFAFLLSLSRANLYQ